MRRHWIGLTVALGMLVVWQGLAQGALPPSAYDRMRKNAMAVAVIQVTDVRLGKARGNPDRGWMTAVTVRARVVTVERGIGLSAGQEIVIRYNNFRPPTAQGWAGPAPVPVLRTGMRRRAWLNPASRIGWKPAAGARSFEAVK